MKESKHRHIGIDFVFYAIIFNVKKELKEFLIELFTSVSEAKCYSNPTSFSVQTKIVNL